MVISKANALKYAAEKLSLFSDEPQREAKHIVAHLLGVPLNRLAIENAEIDSGKIDEIIEKRKKGIPLQYIFGKWWFYNSEFLVGEGVLIPRQDTEMLVETAIDFARGKENLKVADLCSGSGCIAISLALELKKAQVTAVEKYGQAYEFLLKNIEHNKADNVTPVKADVLDKPFGEYDIIVCNPPYIPECEKQDLSREVLAEPHTALFGGEDGLYFYKEIAKRWKTTLANGGRLAFEVGIKEADKVSEILEYEGYTEIGTRCDLFGIQRVVFGTVNTI